MKGRCISVAGDKGRPLQVKACGRGRKSCMNCSHRMYPLRAPLADEGGYLLLEFLASFPVYIVLLVSLFALWLFFLKSYVVLMGDWELQQEMRLTLERIAQDASSAAHVDAGSETLQIERYVNGKKSTTEYALHEGKQGLPPYISKKVSGEDYGYYAPQPMTGGSNVFGSLVVVDFKHDKQGTGLLRLCLTGENRRTKKRVTFSTFVCLPQEKEGGQSGKAR